LSEGNPLRDLPKLDKGALRRHRHAQHIAEHRHADLHAHAREKPGQRGARKKIGEESQFENARKGEKPCGKQTRPCLPTRFALEAMS